MSSMSPWVSAHSAHSNAEKASPAVDIVSVEENQFELGTKRGLGGRQIQIIALAGAIGTGLFIGSGSALYQCGPASLLIAYTLMSGFILAVMNQLTEMVVYLPLPGEATMYALSRKYAGPMLSFVVGWNLYYAMAMIPPAEITACGLIIQYWSDANVAIWIAIFIVATIAINVLPVKVFGESEFWIGSIKLVCLTGLIILGIVIFFGGAPNQDHVLGFHYWKDPGSFVEHLVPGPTGRFLGIWTAIIKSGFAFILCPELVTACSSETINPRYNLKKAAGRFAYRLAFFYIFGVIIIGIVCPSTDSRLMSGTSNATSSPFVVGIKVLPHIVNACILTSAFSAGNSLMYSASRMLFTMALKGDAPKIFAYCNKAGVPIYSVAVTSIFCFLAFLNCSDSASQVFTWLSNISTVSGFIEWVFVSVTYIRFRKAIAYHQMEDRIPYRPKFQFVGCYASLVMFTVLAITNGYAVFIKGNWSISDFFASYITVGFVIVLFGISIFMHRDKRLLLPIPEVDCVTGLAYCEKEEEEFIVPVGKNLWQKFYIWLF